MAAHHESLADHYAGAVADGDQLLHIRRIHAHRLLAQHVLARLGRARRPRHVQVIGQRIVNGIDVGIGQ